MFYGIMKIDGLEQGSSEMKKKSGNSSKMTVKASPKNNESIEEKPRQYYSSPCMLQELDEEE
jgi:hypothetical protein